MMAQVPTRLLVLQRFQKLLEGPLIIDGVSVDMTGRVFRGRNLLGEETTESCPALAIIEAPRPDIAVFAGENEARSDALTLLITGLMDDNKEQPGDAAYYLHAAVQEQLAKITAINNRSGNAAYPEHYMLGNTITALAIAPPVVRPEGDKLSSKASFFLPVRVGNAGLLAAPYTSVP